MEAMIPALEATLALLAEGRRDVTLRAIATRAKVPAALLLRAYGDRDAVLRAAAAHHYASEDALEPPASLSELVRHRMARVAATAPLERALLHEPATQWSASPYGAVDDPRHRKLEAALRDVTPPVGLSRADVAEMASVALRGALVAALEERPQYLDDEAFAAELASTLEHLASATPSPYARVHARSNEHRYFRVRPRRGTLRKAPTQARSASLVEAVLEAVESLLTRRGTVTMTDIAKVAGVSVGSLYQYFASAESVAGALVDRWMAHDLALVERLVEELAPLPLATRYEVGISRIWDRAVRGRAIYRFMFPLVRRLERYGPVQDFLAEARDLMFEAHRADAEGIDLSLALFVFGHAFTALMRAILVNRAELALRVEIRTLLLRWARALVERA